MNCAQCRDGSRSGVRAATDGSVEARQGRDVIARSTNLLPTLFSHESSGFPGNGNAAVTVTYSVAASE
jgi:hypothetical protein